MLRHVDADLLFTAGRVWTGASDDRPVEAVAVRAGRIVAVGSEADLSGQRGPRTETVHIGDGLLLPAFQDAHCHPLWGGLATMACDLSASDSPEAWLEDVAAYAQEHPTLALISGEGWDPYPFPGNWPDRRLLDQVVPDRPVVLVSRDGHSTWANTAALRAAGIGRDTPDLAGGHIRRDGDGEATGVFHEAAKALVERLIPEPDMEQRTEGLRRGQAYLHRLGIAAWLDAIVDPVGESTYLDMARRGELTGRAVLALRWDPERGPEQLEELVARRAAIEAHGFEHLRPTAIKLFVDGVIESSTASLLQPYEDGSATDGDARGASIYPAAALRDICVAVDAAGFDVQAHAIGDRAVREALDALEAARMTNGRRDARHAIAHLELVDAQDIPRFAGLDAIADCQPLWAVHDATDNILGPRLGSDRLERRYPFGRLRDASAPLAMGSDWNVSTADPLQIMHVAVSRTPADTPDAPPLGPPSERLRLEEALRAYTWGSARVHRLEHETGTIEVGKAADLVLLDVDPFAPGARLPDSRVRLTMVDGQVVYEAG